MGGFGSGRTSTRCREKVEHTRFIRAEWVKERMRALQTGIATKIGWTRDGKPYGEASVSLIGNRLHIKYLQRSADEDEWQDVLLSGHHENINKYRHEKQIELTKKNRPDLLGGEDA